MLRQVKTLVRLYTELACCWLTDLFGGLCTCRLVRYCECPVNVQSYGAIVLNYGIGT